MPVRAQALERRGITPRWRGVVQRLVRGARRSERLRVAGRADTGPLLEYLARDPYYNLFLSADIAIYGLGSGGMDVFVQERNGKIEAVLLQCLLTQVLYAHDPAADLTPMTEEINRSLYRRGRWVLSGRQEVLDAVLPRVKPRPEEACDHVFSVWSGAESPAPAPAPLVRAATLGEAAEVNGLLDVIPEFAGPRTAVPTLQYEIGAGYSVVAIVRDGAAGPILSTATSEAESGAAAMITCVATRPGHRGRGHAGACVSYLLRRLHCRGKRACLFFRNPAAGALYHRLGFRDIGQWKVVKFLIG